MGCKQCCRSFGFTILSVLSIGAAVALLSAAVYFIATKFKGISDSLLTIVIIALCVSVLVFLFSLYASTKDNKCVRTVLTFIYIIFALVMGAAGIFLLAFKGELLKIINDAVVRNQTDVTYSIETAFNCQMLTSNDTSQGGREQFYDSECESKVDEFYKSKIPPIGGCLIADFVVLMFGVVMSFRYICRKEKLDLSPSDQSNKSREQLNSPLTYGW